MSRSSKALVILTILLSFSCKKEALRPDHTLASIPDLSEIKAIHAIDPKTLFLSGGKFEEEGFIYRSLDGGTNWVPVFRSGWCVNDVAFIDPMEGYACGDSLHILRTRDGGSSWEPVELSWYPNPEYILPLKKITFADEKTWFFTGGRYYQYGINVRTQNGGLWLDNEVFQVELNSAFFSDGMNGLLAGYGIVYRTPDANQSFIPMDFRGDNLTSLSFISPDKGLACGYNGGIYSTDDGGFTWTTRMRPNGYLGRRIHFNEILFLLHGCLVVGEQGVAYYSEDRGHNWTELDLGTDADLHDIEYIEGEYLVVGSDGSFIRLRT